MIKQNHYLNWIICFTLLNWSGLSCASLQKGKVDKSKTEKLSLLISDKMETIYYLSLLNKSNQAIDYYHFPEQGHRLEFYNQADSIVMDCCLAYECEIFKERLLPGRIKIYELNPHKQLLWKKTKPGNYKMLWKYTDEKDKITYQSDTIKIAYDPFGKKCLDERIKYLQPPNVLLKIRLKFDTTENRISGKVTNFTKRAIPSNEFFMILRDFEKKEIKAFITETKKYFNKEQIEPDQMVAFEIHLDDFNLKLNDHYFDVIHIFGYEALRQFK